MGATIISILVGLWLMISPAFLPMSQAVANNNYITGPLAITFSVIAIWEINRKAIKANFFIGVWLLIALLVLPFHATAVMVSNAVSGLVLLLLSLAKRKGKQNYGGGWRSLFQHNPPHLRAAERDSFGAES